MWRSRLGATLSDELAFGAGACRALQHLLDRRQQRLLEEGVPEIGIARRLRYHLFADRGGEDRRNCHPIAPRGLDHGDPVHPRHHVVPHDHVGALGQRPVGGAPEQPAAQNDVDPTEVERILLEGGFDALTVVHSETSTGVLNPLPEIAEAVRAVERRSGDEIMILVDGVTSVGGMLVEAEGWKLDFLLTGSQKALALPPGLALGAASERLLRRAETIPGRGQYLDLLEYEKFALRNQTPTTPALSLIYALDEQLRSIEATGGIEARSARHWTMAERCWRWTAETLGDHGFSVLAPEGRRSPTVTTIRLPDGVPSAPFVAALKERGYTIGAGYGRLKETTIRIGHMGDHTPEGLELLLDQLTPILLR
jgi:aspartate aminotransferase-like enzyme